MTSLSSGWKEKSLGEICTFKYGKALPQTSRNGGEIPVYGSNGVVGHHDSAITTGQTIVIGRKGSHGEVNFSDSPCWPIDTAYFVDETSTQQDIKWLSYRLASLGLNQLNKAAAVPGLNREDAYRQLLLVPPLPEQRRIAAILDQADALRAKRREALAQLESLTQSIFVEMFVGNANVPMTTFGEVASLKRGPFGGALKKEIFVEAGPMVYEQRNAIYDDCRTGRYFISESKFSEMKDFCVKPDDLIVSCSGTLGKVALVPDDAPEGIINQALLRVRVDTKTVSPTFAKYVLESEDVQRKLKSVSHGTGLQNFPPMSEVKALNFPLPSISLQRQFAERIQMVTDQKGLATSSAMALESLFSSLQHRAFRGDL